MTWKRFPHHWPFVRGIHQTPVVYPCKVSVVYNFDIFFDVSWTSCWKTPLRSCEVPANILSHENTSHGKEGLAPKLIFHNVFFINLPYKQGEKCNSAPCKHYPANDYCNLTYVVPRDFWRSRQSFWITSYTYTFSQKCNNKSEEPGPWASANTVMVKFGSSLYTWPASERSIHG